MLVRNPYETNPEVIDNDEYLNFEELFKNAGNRMPPPFFPPNNKSGPNKPPPPKPGDHPNQSAVPGPPPSFTPKQSNTDNLKVSPGSIKPCKYQYVYIWLNNGNSFWAWVTHIDKTTLSGYKWNSYRWVYFGIDLDKIASFECYIRDTIDKNLTDDQFLTEKEFYIEDDLRVFPPFSPPGGPGFGPGPGGPNKGPGPGFGPGPGGPNKGPGPGFGPGPGGPTKGPGPGFGPGPGGPNKGPGPGFGPGPGGPNKGPGPGFGPGPGGPNKGPGPGFGPGPGGNEIPFFPGNQPNPNSIPGPPPSFTPEQTPSSKSSNPNTFKVSPGSIRPCRFQFVYLWLTNGNSFWAWLTNIDRTTASGFRWNGFRWVYFGIDLNRIAFFECYGRIMDRQDDNVVSSLQTQKLAPSTFNIEYPFIDGMVNENIEYTINEEIIDKLDSLFLNQILVPKKIVFNKVEGAYEVPLNNYGLLSIVMSISTLVDGEKTPRTTFDSLTVDLTTGEVYNFDDLFNPKIDYQSAINDIAINKSKKNNGKFIIPYEGVTDTQRFYLTPKALVLYYQVDEYTPATEGLFRISIPYTQISNYLLPDSPIDKILNNSNAINSPSTKISNENTNMMLPYNDTDMQMPIPFTEGGPEYFGTYTKKNRK